MPVDFESTQSVEIFTENNGHEVQFTFELRCTAPSFPGYFDPRVGGEPPSAPEFEPESIIIRNPEVKKPDLTLDWDGFVLIVGEDIAEEMFGEACIHAAIEGGF